MKNTLLVYSSNRLVETETAHAVAALVAAGAGVVEQRDTADVGLARNFALTMALRVLAAGAHDVALMVDDDMIFSVEQARALVEHARATGRPCSAAYVVNDGRLAAHHVGGGLWWTGLGMLAIPALALEAVANTLPRFWEHEQEWIEFTYSKSEPDTDKPGRRKWVPEDYRLCANLGGVALLPLCVGHIKKRALFPNAETLPAFIEKVIG